MQLLFPITQGRQQIGFYRYAHQDLAAQETQGLWPPNPAVHPSKGKECIIHGLAPVLNVMVTWVMFEYQDGTSQTKQDQFPAMMATRLMFVC